MTTEGKDKNEVSKNSNKKSSDFNYTVSEGSLVILDVYEFIGDKEISTIKSYSWEQTSGIPVIGVGNKNTHIFSFTAPYVKGDNVNTRLSFQLTTTNSSDKITTHSANVIVKKVHRAVIFQGGVALGAYEAGAFQALVENLRRDDESKVNLLNEKKPLFDIVAGTSIGAMNAAIVVNDIIEHKSWEDSAKDLVKFWNNQEYLLPTISDGLDMNPIYHYWWEIIHTISKASKQSASTLLEAYFNLNPYLNNWHDFLVDYFLVDPNFWKVEYPT